MYLNYCFGFIYKHFALKLQEENLEYQRVND